MLKQELVKNHDINHLNRQVIGLNKNDSKIVLLQQHGKMAECGNSNMQSDAKNYESMEILQKLPSDTIVIRQEGKMNRRDSDYKELMETSSNSSSSTSNDAIVKLKISRAVRNKTHEIREMRRNPMRVSKKNAVRDFARPKRLLTNNKRKACSDYKSSKHMKLSTMPYMNTRSVTRKMYTVGATYQPPTKRDEIEWKEWPVHGMHERPVYHLQAGLAMEYLGKYFTSPDGLSYCEIIDESDIEVIAVDPHCERVSSDEKKLKGKMKVKTKCSLNVKDTLNTYLSMKNKSFEMYMHRTFHCVLGYCSRIMTSVYRQTVQDKIMKLIVPVTKLCSLELTKNTTDIKDNAISSLENTDKFSEKAKLLKAYAITMTPSVQDKSITITRIIKEFATTFPSSSTIYIPKALRSTEIDRSKITPQSKEMIRMNLKRFFRSTPNSSLILLRSSATKMSGEVCTITAKNVFNPTKLENMSISDETLMKISSVYKKLMLINKPALSCEELPARNNLYTLKKHATIAQKYATKNISLEKQENKKIDQITKKVKNKNINEMEISKKSESEISITNCGKSCTWYMNETSEIAKILSEYNRSTLRKSAIQNQVYGSRSMRSKLTNSNIKSLSKNIWQKDITVEENQNLITDTNVRSDFSQGTRKQLHLTLEKVNSSQVVNSNQNTWSNSSTSFRTLQIPLRNKQLNTSNIKEKFIGSHKDSNKSKIVMADARMKEIKSKSKDETEISKMESLQDLLENTAILYCAANGVHQDDLSNYIDTLDNKQSIQWLES